MPDLPPEAYEDCFHPPSIPTEVFCLHCQKVYESYLIEWRVEACEDGERTGFWCCPMPGCDGKGFGFDIHPTDGGYIDPDGRDMGQWVDDCSGDEECECEECTIARGELDEDDLDEIEAEGDSVHVNGAPDRDPSPLAVPLDDLLPSDATDEVDIGFEAMMEIEKKLGFRSSKTDDDVMT